VPDGLLGQFSNDLTVTPNGVMFVKDTIRPGVLPRMLREILDTRVMIKKSMSDLKSNTKLSAEEKEILYRILNARQYGLKMIANVTYGYTSANYSGRMPMSDIADAIVQIGRCTLEQAIQTVNKDFAEHNARIVYGDTDSLFVEVVGATREQAFKVGRMIADTITAQNPSPMKLQMEKVFHPCVLVTKKRYVGFAYSDPNQKEPVFDAKGIETVRRDTCKAVATMMETSLRIIFNTKDISKVKEYCERQWTKIMRGKVNVKDFIFAKEVRLGTYSERGTLPPAAIVAMEEMKRDPRAEPLYSERVSYVVVYGDPEARLIDMVVSPHKFLQNQGLNMRLHSTYYITRQIIPALDRLFSLMGVDIKSWYEEMPKRSRVGWRQYYHCSRRDSKGKARNQTIDSFYGTRFCLVCETGLINYQKKQSTKRLAIPDTSSEAIATFICKNCQKDPQQTTVWLYERYRDVGNHLKVMEQVCMHCVFGCHTNHSLADCCNSLDCGVMFTRKRVQNHYNSIDQIVQQYQQLQAPIVDHEDWF
jgi:DNA polymerase zeta